MSPEEIAAIRERAEKANAEMDRLTAGSPGANWRWSIPANPERDTDLILAASTADVTRLLAEVERLTANDAEVAAKAKIELLNELSREALPDQAIRYIASDDVTPSTGHINSWLWMRAAGIREEA